MYVQHRELPGSAGAPPARDGNPAMTTTETERLRSSTPKRRISLGRGAVAGLACLPLLLFALGFARFAAGQKAIAGLSMAGVDVAGLPTAEVERHMVDYARAL